MEDANNKLIVVHGNDLVEASYSLLVDEIRLLLLASSKIDSRKGDIGVIEIFASEYMAAFHTDPRKVYGVLKQAIKSIGRKPIKMPLPNNKTREMYWLSFGEYDNDDAKGSCVKLRFNPDLTPYLYELSENFTIINFEQASQLNTPFSFRLYQWLIKAKNLRSAQDGAAISVILEVDWMKNQAGITGDIYNRWDKFSDKHIKPAIELINAKTDISVIWKPIRKGRSINAVKFSYVVETGAFAKPLRPRLKRRPKVIKGSDAEGSWMRANLKLLLDYEAELKAYDSAAKLDIKDIERIAEYSSIYDRVTHKRALQELAERRAKRTPNE